MVAARASLSNRVPEHAPGPSGRPFCRVSFAASVLAIAASLITPACSNPPERLSEQLVEELLDARLADPAKVAAIVSQRTGASVRAGDRRVLGDEVQQGLLGTDRSDFRGSACSRRSAGVAAGWAWVSRYESSVPEESSARGAAIWIATSLAGGGDGRDAPPFGVEELAKAFATLQIPDGQKWSSRLLGDPANPTLVFETVPIEKVSAGGPVPWVLLAFRADTPAGRATLARLASGARLELAERPALFAFRSGADQFLRPTAVPRPTVGIAEALPPPPSLTPLVSDADVAWEGYDDIPAFLNAPGGRIIPRRRRVARVFFDRERRVVGVSAEVSQYEPAENFVGGWYKSNEKELLRQWRTFLANHTRKGTDPSEVEPLRCPWPPFLPRPSWFDEPAELPVRIDGISSRRGPMWSAGGRLLVPRLRYAWFGIDEEGTIRYCIHQTDDPDREYRWAPGEDPGFEAKSYKGFPVPARLNLPEPGQETVTFYDSRIEFEPTGQPTILPAPGPFLYGPLFPEDADPIVLRVIPLSKAESRRPWGELPGW